MKTRDQLSPESLYGIKRNRKEERKEKGEARIGDKGERKML